MQDDEGGVVQEGGGGFQGSTRVSGWRRVHGI